MPSKRSAPLPSRRSAPTGERNYSEETAREIDTEVRALVQAAFERAVAILSANRALLDDWAKRLLVKETLVEDELKALAAEVKGADAPT